MAHWTKISTIALALSTGSAWAQVQAPGLARRFPAQAVACSVSDHKLPAEALALIDGKSVGLSAALVIRDANNRIVVSSQLPKSFAGMCVLGPGGQLEKVWLLSGPAP